MRSMRSLKFFAERKKFKRIDTDSDVEEIEDPYALFG